VADCPLLFTSPNAPRKRDVLGTLLLSVLAGHRRYAHVTALRCDAVNPPLQIIGPLALALLAGSSNVIAPQATADAVFPAFAFLGGIMLLVALAFVFLGVETHGKPIALGAEGTA